MNARRGYVFVHQQKQETERSLFFCQWFCRDQTQEHSSQQMSLGQRKKALESRFIVRLSHGWIFSFVTQHQVFSWINYWLCGDLLPEMIEEDGKEFNFGDSQTNNFFRIRIPWPSLKFLGCPMQHRSRKQRRQAFWSQVVQWPPSRDPGSTLRTCGNCWVGCSWTYFGFMDGLWYPFFVIIFMFVLTEGESSKVESVAVLDIWSWTSL